MVEIQLKYTRDSESQHRRPGRGVSSAPMTPFEESIQALDADARVTKAVVEQIALEDRTPLAVLWYPPLTEELPPLAVLCPPPLTEELPPLA